MKLINLTYPIIEINAAIDTGKYNDISVDEIKEHIEIGDVFSHISELAGEDIDLSLLDDEVSAEITEALRDILYALGNQARRKWGVENSGLCLLIAWINELIQQRRWQD